MGIGTFIYKSSDTQDFDEVLKEQMKSNDDDVNTIPEADHFIAKEGKYTCVAVRIRE